MPTQPEAAAQAAQGPNNSGQAYRATAKITSLMLIVSVIQLLCEGGVVLDTLPGLMHVIRGGWFNNKAHASPKDNSTLESSCSSPHVRMRSRGNVISCGVCIYLGVQKKFCMAL